MRWKIIFEENGPEYEGILVVQGKKLEQTSSAEFIVDGVYIGIDEDIKSISILTDDDPECPFCFQETPINQHKCMVCDKIIRSSIKKETSI